MRRERPEPVTHQVAQPAAYPVAGRGVTDGTADDESDPWSGCRLHVIGKVHGVTCEVCDDESATGATTSAYRGFEVPSPPHPGTNG